MSVSVVQRASERLVGPQALVWGVLRTAGLVRRTAGAIELDNHD